MSPPSPTCPGPARGPRGRRPIGFPTTNLPERRILLLAEERFRPAGELLTEAVAELAVTLEVPVVDDVLAAAREQIEAQQELDRVLPDRGGSEAVKA